MNETIISRKGKAYSDGDVHIAMLGTIDHEVTKIDYDMKQAHTPHYSLGSVDPTSYSQGRKEYACSLGLRLKSASAIEKAAGVSLTEIKPFPIVVVVVNEENEIIKDILTVKFKEQKRSYGDKDDVVCEYDMFCLGIQFNV
ncbi:MAG: hypothetical protein IKU05_05420 [Bacteroidales bacterium]|nr:hypothetical protein [Bacteroidales bacterium]MBR6438043.1 hypothetical protein [Bacteroidales bacterium]